MATPVAEEASFSKEGALMPQSKNKIKSVATALLSVLALVTYYTMLQTLSVRERSFSL